MRHHLTHVFSVVGACLATLVLIAASSPLDAPFATAIVGIAA